MFLATKKMNFWEYNLSDREREIILSHHKSNKIIGLHTHDFSLDFVKCLIENGFDPNIKYIDYHTNIDRNYSFLSEFARRGDVKGVEFLLQKRADVKYNKYEALRVTHNKQIMRMLLEAGSDVNVITDRIPCLIKNKVYNVLRLLKRYNAMLTCDQFVYNIVQYGCREHIEYCIENFNCKQHLSIAMKFAVNRNHNNIDLIEILLDNGADINDDNYILQAYLNNNIKMMKFLIKCNASVKHMKYDQIQDMLRKICN